MTGHMTRHAWMHCLRACSRWACSPGSLQQEKCDTRQLRTQGCTAISGAYHENAGPAANELKSSDVSGRSSPVMSNPRRKPPSVISNPDEVGVRNRITPALHGPGSMYLLCRHSVLLSGSRGLHMPKISRRLRSVEMTNKIIPVRALRVLRDCPVCYPLAAAPGMG